MESSPPPAPHRRLRVPLAQRQCTHQRVRRSKRDQPNESTKTRQRAIQQLRHEIQRLTQSRDMVVAQQLHRFDDLDGSGAKTVVEYFRVLARGLLLSPVDATAFLQNVMAEDIRINSFVGRDVVVKQWRNHSLCWGDVHMEVLDTNVVPLTIHEAVVTVDVTFTVTISRLTLAMAFPHILQCQPIVERLLGRTLVGHSRQDFVYDACKKQVVQMVVVLNFVRAFSELVLNPTLLATLFEGAMITDQFFTGEINAETARKRREAEQAARINSNQRAFSPNLEETKHETLESGTLQLEGEYSSRRRHWWLQ